MSGIHPARSSPLSEKDARIVDILKHQFGIFLSHFHGLVDDFPSEKCEMKKVDW